jgi:hypothetical protein
VRASGWRTCTARRCVQAAGLRVSEAGFDGMIRFAESSESLQDVAARMTLSHENGETEHPAHAGVSRPAVFCLVLGFGRSRTSHAASQGDALRSGNRRFKSRGVSQAETLMPALTNVRVFAGRPAAFAQFAGIAVAT